MFHHGKLKKTLLSVILVIAASILLLSFVSEAHAATFGNTSTGAYWYAYFNGYGWYWATASSQYWTGGVGTVTSSFTAPANGVVTSLSGYLSDSSSSGGIYFVLENSAGSVLAQTGTFTTTQPGGGLPTANSGETAQFTLYTESLSSTDISSGQTYLIGVVCSGSTIIIGLTSTGGSPSLYATYTPDYTITVNSVYGNPTSSGSVDPGGSYATSVTSPISGGSGIQYVCVGYSIDNGGAGAQYSGSSYTFTGVSAAHTIWYYWMEQVYLTVQSSYGSPSGSGWYNAGATAYADLNAGTVSAGSGAQYAFSSWSTGGSNYAQSNAITMNGPVTASAAWVTQYYLTVTSSYGSPSGAGWCNQGATANFGVSTPVSGGSGVQYAFNTWSGLGSGGYAGALASSSVTMNAAITETASWTTQYQVTFAQVGLDSTAQGTIVTINGNGEAYSALPYQVWMNSGAQVTFAYSSTVASSTSGKQFLVSNVNVSSPLTVTAATTVTGTYGIQYYLTITSAYGNPSGQGWVNAGSQGTFSVSTPTAGSAGVQYVFSSWTGSGSGYYSGSSASTSVTMNNPITETASWITQYQVTFSQSGLDSSASSTVVTVNSNAKAYGALPYTLWVNSGASVTFTFSSSVSSSVTGESFTLQSTSANSPLTVNAAETVTGSYSATINGGGGNCILTVKALDMSGGALPSASVTLNGTAYSALSGQFSLSGITSGSIYVGSVTWENVDVNASFAVSVNANVTLNVQCTAYPFTLNSVVHHVASDRAVVSEAWDGTHLQMNFSASAVSNSLVTDCSQIPTYVDGVSYALGSAWNSGTGVFSASVANTTASVTVNFDSWGSSFYVEEADTPLQSLSWNGQVLTVAFAVSSTGTLVLSCGSYGVPVTVSGMTAAYNSVSTMLTGMYTGQSAIVISWASTGGTGTGSGSNGSGTVTVTLGQGNFGSVAAGSNETATLTFTFSGSSFTATSVTFTGNGAQYVNAAGLPLTFFGGSGSITIELAVPVGASAGTYSLGATLTGLDAYGTEHICSGTAAYTVSAESGYGVTGPQMSSNLIEFIVVIAILACVIIGSLAVLTRRKT
jgi:hypothetical protein